MSIEIENRFESCIDRLYWRPVDGRICIRPYAFADDRTSAVNVDSCAMSAAIMNGSRLFAAEYLRISGQ